MFFMNELKRFRNIIYLDTVPSDKIIYRLHYLYFNDYFIKEVHDCACDAFMIPDGVDKMDAFKVISYFFDHIQYEKGGYRCCCATTEKLNSIGFEKIDNIKAKEYFVVDLFSVISCGNGQSFKQSEYYQNYFEWYCSGVTKEEVLSICTKNNISISFDRNNVLQKKM